MNVLDNVMIGMITAASYSRRQRQPLVLNRIAGQDMNVLDNVMIGMITAKAVAEASAASVWRESSYLVATPVGHRHHLPRHQG
jgi:hypothetical protein